jgi:formate dehydrogenase beta subunit
MRGRRRAANFAVHLWQERARLRANKVFGGNVPHDDGRPGEAADSPGRKGRSARPLPKGRQVDEQARAEIQGLLGERSRARDLLIEHLHLINDRHGALSLRHLAALAAEMRLSYAEVYEVATFYAHFRILERIADEDALPVVRVCDGIACMIAGAGARETALRAALQGKARVEAAPCIGACHQAPAAVVGFRTVPSIAAAALASPEVPAISPATADAALHAYRASGGHAMIEACRNGTMSATSVFDALDAAGMRGLGGAGFPTGRKWRLVASQPAPRLMAINADEGEPGTFKDRWFLEQHAHRVLEGALIGAWATGCATIYLYVRDEYPEARETLSAALGALERAGMLGGVRVDLRRGAGAYVCGEESAMLESIEGRRGQPRHKPPFPAERGLFDRPTLINNVETLWWVPEILARGGDWFAAQGRRGGKGCAPSRCRAACAIPG